MKPPQPIYHGSARVGQKERTMNIVHPVTKNDSARLGRKWYIVGKDGRPIKEMKAFMIRRVQRQHRAHMNSMKIPTILEAYGNVKFEEATLGGRKQLQWRTKKRQKELIVKQRVKKPCTLESSSKKVQSAEKSSVEYSDDTYTRLETEASMFWDHFL